MLPIASYLQILSVLASFIGLVLHLVFLKGYNSNTKVQIISKIFMILALLLLVIVYIISYISWKQYSKTKREISLNIIQTGFCFIPVALMEIIFLVT
jgi:hypothetical protein